MQVILCQNASEAAELVSERILEALRRKPDLVLGLATGSTPIGVYQRLVRAHQEENADFSQVRTFNLDEYIGLSHDHPASYHSFMRKHFFDLIKIPERNIGFPPSSGPKLLEQCRRYEEAIRDAGGIDLQLLGIGSNGHIGFNEPTSSLASRTRLKTLTEKTMRDNARFYGVKEKQPQMASTMGIGTILESKQILLQAFGRKKAEAIRAAVEGPISSFCPGSALQLHPGVTFYLDPDSASLLTELDYYRRVRENREEIEKRGLL